jgi:hypothetical protein
MADNKEGKMDKYLVDKYLEVIEGLTTKLANCNDKDEGEILSRSLANLLNITQAGYDLLTSKKGE